MSQHEPPGLLWCVAWVVGVAAGLCLLTTLAWCICAITGLCVVAVFRTDRVGIALLLCAAGVAWGGWSRDRALAEAAPGLLGEAVVVEGTLLRDASVGPAGVRLDLDVQGTRVRVTVVGELALTQVGQWRRGDTVSAPLRLRRPTLVRNPGSPSVEWQRLTAPFDLIGSIKSAGLLSVSPGPWWERLGARLRQHVRNTVATHVGHWSATSAAIVTAILIGDRAGLDDVMQKRLQVAGTFHVIAISGGNMAMLTAGLLTVGGLITRRYLPPLVVTLLLVVTYGWVVGGDPAVDRAVLAAALYLGLRIVSLVPAPLNLLAVVAAVITMWEPLAVVDVGAWLSFGATLGLLVVLPRLVALSGHRVWMAVVLATLAVEIVILPVTTQVFGRMTIAGLGLNLVAIPAMAVAQAAGLVLAVLAPLSAMVATGVGWFAHVGAVSLVESSRVVDLLPWIAWRVPPSPWFWVLAYYLLLVGALLWRGRRVVRRGLVAVVCVCALVLATGLWVTHAAPAPRTLRVAFLDVGQGDATLVQLPNGRVLLVDAGGSPGSRFDVGGRVVTPAVWALGARNIDWLALTHGDIDHVGGAASVVEDLAPDEVWEGVPVEQMPLLHQLRGEAADEGRVWRRLQAGDHFEAGGAVVRVLHPRAPEWQRLRVRNDDSLVLEVQFGNTAIVLPGDAGVEFEAQVVPPMPWGRPAPIRILKVAHHGSRTSSSLPFLERWPPQIAVVSAGAHNVFGHPAPDVVARLERSGATVFRTDRDGAVIIETDGREVLVRDAHGRQVRLSVDEPPPS